MKKILFFFFLQMIAKTTLFGQLAEDVEYCVQGKTNAYHKLNLDKLANLRYPGDANFDVKYYKLNLELTYSPNYLKGIVTIKAKSLQAGLNNANIDLQNALTVDSVFVNNVKTAFTHQSAIINIDLKKAYVLNEVFDLVIYYQGKPGSSGFGSFTFGSHGPNSDPAIWSLSEPFGSSDWFPCKDNPSDKADSSDVWITAPKYFVSVSNGILEQKIENATTNTYKWKSRYPIANYLISIALANYDYYKNDFEYGGNSPMLVDHYIFPEYNTPANKLLMDDTVYMLNLFTEKFGPYPFLKERYGHAMFGWGGGMEHQTCSSMVNISSGLTAHELTHQWFGDKITCQDWSNIWLNEGFATFGALIYWEAKNGKAEYKTRILSTMNAAKTAVGSVWVQNPVSVSEIFNSARSYSKGSIILHMLRNIIGDAKFFDILKAYTASIHAYGNATTEGFQAIVENIMGEDFNYFFSEWVYGQKYPKYEFSWGVFQSPNGRQGGTLANYNLKFRISQLINLPLPAYFTMPIDLKVTFSDNSSQIVRVFNDSQDQFFEFNFDKNVVDVTFDPENGILKDLSIIPFNSPLSLEEEVIKVPLSNEKLAKKIDFQLSPNPSNDNLKISFKLKLPLHSIVTIVGQSGNIIFTKQFEYKSENEGFNINTSQIPNGYYFVKLHLGNEIIARKILILH